MQEREIEQLKKEAALEPDEKWYFVDAINGTGATIKKPVFSTDEQLYYCQEMELIKKTRVIKLQISELSNDGEKINRTDLAALFH